MVHPTTKHWIHHLEVDDVEDIDAEVVGWLWEAARPRLEGFRTEPDSATGNALRLAIDSCDDPILREPDYLANADPHLDPLVAAAYDDAEGEMFRPQAIHAAVAVLSELAEGGTAVEFAVGTGRLALPLAERGVEVYGIDFSEPMLAELRRKEGAELVSVTMGDMTQTQVCEDANLVYLVYNTIMNLRTQSQQMACFHNAAAHLAPGGCFLIENLVPQLHRLPPGETIVPFDISPNHLGFDEYVDRANQISISHHYSIDGDRVRISTTAFRYVWPSELDLMGELAGLTLESRWADWDRSTFTGESISHVSVWRKP